jgi:hypothetical protein
MNLFPEGRTLIFWWRSFSHEFHTFLFIGRLISLMCLEQCNFFLFFSPICRVRILLYRVMLGHRAKAFSVRHNESPLLNLRWGIYCSIEHYCGAYIAGRTLSYWQAPFLAQLPSLRIEIAHCDCRYFSISTCGHPFPAPPSDGPTLSALQLATNLQGG